MPWKECDTMSLREEFVSMAMSEGANLSFLCRRFGISRTTGSKWVHRYRAQGREGLRDSSRRPHHSPSRTEPWLEATVLKLRDRHPAWGGRKLRRRLQDLGTDPVPAASTITEILRRHGRIDASASEKARSFVRFEHASPNDLWQMDFKGHFGLLSGGRCHLLTVLDDHSRFSLGLRACGNEQSGTVRAEWRLIFRRYGLPRAMLMDNGAPWGSARDHCHTSLTVWLMEQGIRVTHGRPYHPQTQGKEERFHRTLRAELLRGREFCDLRDAQERFDPWRDLYNTERPHEALGLGLPVSRYTLSPRGFKEEVLPWDYGPGAETRKVYAPGLMSYGGREYKLGKAFEGMRVGIRPLSEDGLLGVYFCQMKVHEINLHEE